MKKGLAFVIAIGILLLVPLASANIIDWITGKLSAQPTEVNIPVGNTAPKIITIYNSTDGATLQGIPFEESYRDIAFKFTAYDHDNSTDLNDATAAANFARAGETTRSTSCAAAESSGKYRNYTCTIRMWYWDRAGEWTLTATVDDLDAATATNNSVLFTYDTLLAFKLNPTNLTWPILNHGATNINSSNHPSYLNNTGNNLADVTINATDLAGNVDPTTYIDANDFKVSQNSGDQCSRTSLDTSTFTLIQNSSSDPVKLTRGNLSIGTGTGQQTLYYCLTAVNAALTKQTYSTTQNGVWNIQIVQNPA